MRELIERLNPAFDNRFRLGIMALLCGEPRVEYNTLLDLLGMSKGNLASHLRVLEQEGFVEVHKSFVDRKSRTTYNITEAGRAAWRGQLDALNALLVSAEEAWALEE